MGSGTRWFQKTQVGPNVRYNLMKSYLHGSIKLLIVCLRRGSPVWTPEVPTAECGLGSFYGIPVSHPSGRTGIHISHSAQGRGAYLPLL